MRRRGLVSVVVGLVLVRTALVACVGDDPTPPARRGDENGECFADLTCNTGLDCLSGRCVRLPAKDATPTPVAPDAPPPATSDTGADTEAPPESDATAPDADAAEPPEPDAGAPACIVDAGICALPSLVAWFRADRGVVLDARRVKTWKDQSLNGRDLRLRDADTAPTFWDASSNIFSGGPRLEFNGPPQQSSQGTAERLVTAPFGADLTPTTVYVVLSRRGDRSFEDVIDGLGAASTKRHSISFSDTAGATAFIGGPFSIDITIGADAATDKTMLFEAVFDGNQSQIRINDNAYSANGGIGMAVLAGLTIGSSRPDTTQKNNFGGSIAEVLVFNKVQDAAERQQVITWLRQRHGL